MAERKNILVTGATGAQGGSVARNLLKSGQFSVRAISRNPDSPAAGALREAGAEVVAADMAKPETLKRAMDGCWGVFAVTNFWEHFDRELELGRNTVDAARAAGVEYFIYSGLPSCKKISGGKYNVPHFDIKAEVEDYARATLPKTAFTHVPFYYENFIGFGMLQKQPDGTLGFGFPQGDTPLAMVAVEDIGGVVRPMFERPDEFAGKTVGIVGDDRPCDEYARIMTRLLGVQVNYQHIPLETYAKLGFPGAEELGNMFEFNRYYIPNRKADLEETRKLYPQIRTLEQWLEQNKGQFQAMISG